MNIEIDINTVGVALLVSNDYDSDPCNRLLFTHKDTDHLEKVLKELSYYVLPVKNASTDKFVSCYKKLAEFKYPTTCKRILLYFSGHGADGILVMQDGGEVNIDDVISSFKIHIAANKSLATMAKMFFFDACRGKQQDDGYSVKAAGPDDEITCLRKVPKEGNMLIAYASTRYHVSYGEDSAGSRWTDCLVRAMRESKESDGVLHILTEANIMLRKEPNHRYFQTAEFTSSLVDHVYFKKEAIKMRNILLLGVSGSGKCTLISKLIGDDFGDDFVGFRPLHIHNTLVINNIKYQCTFIKPFGIMEKDDVSPLEEIAKSHREYFKRLNLIIYVVNLRSIDVETLQVYTKFFKNTRSISALVFTHSRPNPRNRRILEEFKSRKDTKDIAANMGKGIYTVDFFDTSTFSFDEEHIAKCSQIMQEDVTRLHQLIEESSNVVDILKSTDLDVPSNPCSII